MPPPNKPLYIYALSDATGELPINIATAAARQFQSEGIQIVRRAKVKDPASIRASVEEAHRTDGVIIFTLVSGTLRKELVATAANAGVVAIDIMGPVMDAIHDKLQQEPSDRPGLKYALNDEYFRRNEAVDYTVKHDDGMGLETLEQADIVLVGVSRSSKTPLAIYLAYRGYRVANVPIIFQIRPPAELFKVDPKKIVGIVVNPDKLVELRSLRLSKLGRPPSEDYANPEKVREEISYARQIFREIGGCPEIDVTLKAIEEAASEVLHVLGK